MSLEADIDFWKREAQVLWKFLDFLWRLRLNTIRYFSLKLSICVSKGGSPGSAPGHWELQDINY